MAGFIERLFGQSPGERIWMTPERSRRHDVISDFGFDPAQRLNLLSAVGVYANFQIQNQNPWVASSINLIRDMFSALPLDVVNVADPTDRMPLSEAGSDFDWLRNPGMLSLKELMEAISFWLDLAGEAFLLVERADPFSLPESVELLPPFALEDREGPDGTLWWRYSSPGGATIDYPGWQILHFKNYGYRGTQMGKKTMRGVPPSLSILNTVAMDTALTKFLRDHLEAPLVLSGIISPKAEAKLSGIQREELAEKHPKPDTRLH